MGSEQEIFNYHYDGPKELKAHWFREARKLYDRVIYSNFDLSLAHKAYVCKYTDGASVKIVQEEHFGKTINVFINVPVIKAKRIIPEELMLKRRRIIPMFDMGLDSYGSILGIHTWQTPEFVKLGENCKMKDGGSFNSTSNGQIPFTLTRWSSNTTKHEIKDFVQQKRSVAEYIAPEVYSSADFVSGGPGSWVWSGTKVYSYYWEMPNGSTALHHSMTVSLSYSVEEWVTQDGAWYYWHWDPGAYNFELSGQEIGVLADSYVEDTGDYALLYYVGDYIPYSESAPDYEETSGALFESELPWVHDDWRDIFPPIADTFSGLLTMNYGLYILTCINGIQKVYDLDVHWDSLSIQNGGNEYRVSGGFINLYKEGIVVYSYTVIEKTGLM